MKISLGRFFFYILDANLDLGSEIRKDWVVGYSAETKGIILSQNCKRCMNNIVLDNLLVLDALPQFRHPISSLGKEINQGDRW